MSDFNYTTKEYAVTVTCKFCNGTGGVEDVSKWPPRAICPGCKGAGVHVLPLKPGDARDTA